MGKNKPTPSKDLISYKQTDINFYFKMKQHNMKENTSATKTIKHSTVSQDKTKQIQMPRPKLVKAKPVLEDLPFPLPVFNPDGPDETKEDLIVNDSAFCSIESNSIENSENCQATASVEEYSKEAIIILSSDDEDFQPLSKKAKKTKHTKDAKKLNRKATAKIDHLEKEKNAKVRRKLYETESKFTEVNKKPEETATESTVSSKIRVRKDLLSEALSTSTQITSQTPIGVNRPSTVIPVTKQKQRPYILQKKQSSSDLDSSRTNISFNSDIIANNESNSFTTEVDVNTPVTPEKTTIDVVISSSSKQTRTFFDECRLSPIRATSTPAISPFKTPNNSPKKSVSSPIVTPNGSQKKFASSPSKTSKRSPRKTPRRGVKPENGEELEDEQTALRLVKKIINFIASHNHLRTMLMSQEECILKRFYEMPNKKYMFFCIKLYTRIQKWYNIVKLSELIKLNMPETEIKNMYDCLSENGFVNTDYSSESCASLLDHLLQKDIKDICDSFRLKLTSSRKPDMIEKLLQNCNRQSTLTFTKTTEQILKERIKEKMGYCVKLNSELYNLFNKVHLLYSFMGSDFQSVHDLYLFMIRMETKEICIPKFPIDMDFKIFSSVHEFSIFADAYECKRAILEAFEKKQLEHMRELSIMAYSELQTILQRAPNFQETKPSYLKRFTAGHKYTKALSIGIKHLVKHYPNEVQEWLWFLIKQNGFCQQMRGEWYDSLIKVQSVYLKEHKEATETLINALGDKDLTEVGLYELNNRAENMKRSKAHKVTTLQYDSICFVQPAPLEEFPAIEINARAVHDNESGKKRQYVEKTETGQNVFNVEQVALNHYLMNGFTQGVHCEGSMLHTILCVLFWDIIYESHVPGVFVTEIQYLPLDFWSREFYLNRQQAIDQRLAEIESIWSTDQLENFMNDIWFKHSREKSLINDTLVENSEELFQVILCVGRDRLRKILERMIKSFKTYHSGLPDLFLWNINERKCKFVEVKGEKDKLSTKQKLWLNFLTAVGADIEVCHVHTVGSKTRAMIKKKPESEMKMEEP